MRHFNNFFAQPLDINFTNFNRVYNDFVDIFPILVDFPAPFETLFERERKLKSKAWIIRSLLKSIKHKQKLYLTYFINGNTEQKKYRIKYANKLNEIKLNAKKCTMKNFRNHVMTHFEHRVLLSLFHFHINRQLFLITLNTML